MRGGPGLGNIAPEQADIKLACRGLGHGNTHAVVLAPATPQEMLDLTMLPSSCRSVPQPVVILGDGYLGQMTGKVRCPTTWSCPACPRGRSGATARTAHNLICSIALAEADLEAQRTSEPQVRAMTACEQRSSAPLRPTTPRS
jgi:pyruvate/2-oxoacid:ferredoxin oxidoreductase alpha subunit